MILSISFLISGGSTGRRETSFLLEFVRWSSYRRASPCFQLNASLIILDAILKLYFVGLRSYTVLFCESSVILKLYFVGLYFDAIL